MMDKKEGIVFILGHRIDQVSLALSCTQNSNKVILRTYMHIYACIFKILINCLGV